MKIRTLIKIVMMLAALSLIWGCGSGGGGTQGSATSKSFKSTLGAVSPSVMGIELTLVLPSGVTPQVDASSGQPVVTLAPNNDVTGSNGAVMAVYTPASSSVKIVIARGDKPFVPGDFFTIVCDVAAGTTVSASGFSTKDTKVYDANGAEMKIPVTASVTVNGATVSTTTGGTGTAFDAKTALQSGFYNFDYSVSPSGSLAGLTFVSVYAIKAVSLGTDGISLTETIKYWDGTQWNTTRPAGIPAGTFNNTNDYFLTSTGWVSGVSGASSNTIAFNPDGTAVITNKYDGSQAKITVTSMDISGQTLSTAAAGNAVSLYPLIAPAPVLPAGSMLYKMAFNQLTDSYDAWDYNSIGTSLTTLSSVPIDSTLQVYIDNNSPNTYFYGQFVQGPGNTVNIYQQSSTATSAATSVQIGTATWAYKTVNVTVPGTQLLVITIPQSLRIAYKLGGDPFFAVINGVVKQGNYNIGGQTSYTNGGTSFNKPVNDYVVANFNSAAAGSITGTVAKSISRAILGF